MKATIPKEEDEDDEADEDNEDENGNKLTSDQIASRKAQRRLFNNPDLRAHQHTLIILLVDSLKSVIQLMSSLKSQRVARMKKEVEEKFPEEMRRRAEAAAAAAKAGRRYSQTQSNDSNNPSATDDPSNHATSSNSAAASSTSDIFPASLTRVMSSSLKKLGVNGVLNKSNDSSSVHLPPLDDSHPSPSDDVEFTMTPHEKAQLLEENRQLLDSLEENLDQIRRAESKMAEISGLIALFTTKVVEQEEQINSIYDHAIKSTLHVHSGIAQLKKAAQRGVTFRMMILFMILMLSFSLLFLDWYIP